MQLLCLHFNTKMSGNIPAGVSELYYAAILSKKIKFEVTNKISKSVEEKELDIPIYAVIDESKRSQEGNNYEISNAISKEPNNITKTKNSERAVKNGLVSRLALVLSIITIALFVILHIILSLRINSLELLQGSDMIINITNTLNISAQVFNEELKALSYEFQQSLQNISLPYY